jgi:hypothetical protein
LEKFKMITSLERVTRVKQVFEGVGVLLGDALQAVATELSLPYIKALAANQAQIRLTVNMNPPAILCEMAIVGDSGPPLALDLSGERREETIPSGRMN